jgi:thiamine biosynthesis lipoprotein
LFHEAMATTFSIRVAHEDPRYARQAVAAAFAELDALESQLSRFVEGSDVWRINRLARGEFAVVAPDTFRCLSTALEVHARTGGAFDVTYASAPTSKPANRLAMRPAGCGVRVLTDGVAVDLGGIGKGYALDVMAAVLRQWDVTAALLTASTSTILALDPPAGEPDWNVTFGPDRDPRRLLLSHAAFSGSGIGVKGTHIIDPRTHEPAGRRTQAWALSATAAQADALSTAFMVMNAAEVRRYCDHDQSARSYLLDAHAQVVHAFPR